MFVVFIAAKTCKQAVCDELNVLPHEDVVHPDKVDMDCFTNKLMLNCHCFGYDFKHALTTFPVIELAAQCGGKSLQFLVKCIVIGTRQLFGH